MVPLSPLPFVDTLKYTNDHLVVLDCHCEIESSPWLGRVRTQLRDGDEKGADSAIRVALAAIWQHRADRYSEIRTAGTAKARKVEMSFIGG